MLIQKTDFLQFQDFCRKYFQENREGKTVEVLDGLKKCERKLYRSIEKAVGKKAIKSYVGRLLKSVKKEGWLVFEKKSWKTVPEWGFCTFCFRPLDDFYLIDINDNQYCNDHCFDELEAVPHYDSYADDYIFLFWDARNLRDRYDYYLTSTQEATSRNPLEISVILRDIYNVINEQTTILFNGGDDGPIAAEMYRILMLLRKDAEKLERLRKSYEKRLL